MARFHLKDDGTPGVCSAKPGNCPKTEEDGSPSPHFESKEAAQEYFEKSMEGDAVSKPEKKVEYSFLKDFKEREENFNRDFEGVPNRFYNADLRGKGIKKSLIEEDAIKIEIAMRALQEMGQSYRVFGSVSSVELSKRFFQAMSAPSDMNASEEEIKEVADSLGADSVVELSKDYVTKTGAKSRAFLIGFKNNEGEEKFVIAIDKAKSNLSEYRFRYSATPPEMRGAHKFTMTDIRSLMGAGRVLRKTGDNPLRSIVTKDYYSRDAEEYKRNRSEMAIASVVTLRKLEEAQREGRDFKNQKRFVRDANGKVATVWEDKKNQSETHKELSRNSSLNRSFSKIEIDNDVDPDEFKDFENGFNEVKDKLPRIPNGRQPELRIRKLGKHNGAGSVVHGLYNPVRNAIAVDVRNSAATIHEMGHYYDLAVKGNSSLSLKARPLMGRYSKNLSVLDDKHREYLSTPTEVYARAFELYAHERLGVNNRLLNPDKFNEDSESFGPFFKDPSLKKDFFSFFDESFKD